MRRAAREVESVWVSTSKIGSSNSMRIWRWCGCSMRTCKKETPATLHGLEDEKRLDIPESCHAPAPARQWIRGHVFPATPLIYTLLGNCRAHGLNAEDYHQEVIKRLPPEVSDRTNCGPDARLHCRFAKVRRKRRRGVMNRPLVLPMIRTRQVGRFSDAYDASKRAMIIGASILPSNEKRHWLSRFESSNNVVIRACARYAPPKSTN